MLKRIYEKAFMSARFFTIAIRKKTHNYIFDQTTFIPQYIFPATLQNWSADPMLIDYEEKTFLFYEAVYNNKGRIEVVEVFDDCSVSAPITVFHEDYHMSYPFVFKLNGKWYMIPETSEKNEVRLFTCTEFPGKWEYERTLLKGKYVDTTVYKTDQGTVMLTYKLSGSSERVYPEAYWIDKNWNLTSIDWQNSDELNVRGAGAVFGNSKAVFRPAQSSTETLYGNSVVFYQMHLHNSTYKEEKVGELKDHAIKAKAIWHDGLHTYSVSDKFEAIDIRCREFDSGKLLRRVFR